MALDFPASPTNGQKYPASPIAGVPTYTWDGEKWTTGTAAITSVYVAKAGDTMTGQLTLPTGPAAANAVRKDYVDAADALKAATTYVDTQDALKVAKTGDTMTGDLTLTRSWASTTGYLFFPAGTFIGWDGSWLVSSAPLSVGGTIRSGNGYLCRAGISGAFGGNAFNLNWVPSKMDLWVDATNLGQITTTTSDYRIKKDVQPLPSKWDTVKALRPISYTQAQYTPPVEIERMLKEAREDTGTEKPGDVAAPMFPADNIERWGFIAHELQETLIESAANSYKDAPDTIQSLNSIVLIAALTRALQEAMARIEALEAA